MNGFIRDLVAQAVIILAVCIGAWMLFVQPKQIELAELEARIERSRLESSGVDESSMQQLADQATDLRSRTAAIERASALGRDSSALYTTMMELARGRGVHVHSLQPGSIEPGPVFTMRQVSMLVEGTYEQLASFLAAVNDMPDYIRPRTMVLSPRRSAAGEPVVHGSLSWDVLSFTLPAELISMKGVDDVQQ